MEKEREQRLKRGREREREGEKPVREEKNEFTERNPKRVPSNTNITIKPNSCQHPNTAIATFKSELCRAYRLCSSPEQAKNEIAFTINLFEDNGHSRPLLESIANTYQPPSHENNNSNNSKRTNSNSKTKNNRNINISND